MSEHIPSQELNAGRYSDEYVRWRIDEYKKEILSNPVIGGTEFQIRDLSSNTGYVLAPDGKQLPDYVFSRECSYLAIIEILKAEYDKAAAMIERIREALKP